MLLITKGRHVPCAAPLPVNLDEGNGKDGEKQREPDHQWVSNLLTERVAVAEERIPIIILMQPASLKRSGVNTLSTLSDVRQHCRLHRNKTNLVCTNPPEEVGLVDRHDLVV